MPAVIGEFGRPPEMAPEVSPALTTPMYWFYELAHASLNPARAMSDATRLAFKNPLNPWSHTDFGKQIAAACEVFERTTRRYGKPDWHIDEIQVNGHPVRVRPTTVWESPWCRLVQFDRDMADMRHAGKLQLDPAVLIVAYAHEREDADPGTTTVIAANRAGVGLKISIVAEPCRR